MRIAALLQNNRLGETERVIYKIIRRRIERGDRIEPRRPHTADAKGLRKITSFPALRRCSADQFASSPLMSITSIDQLVRLIRFGNSARRDLPLPFGPRVRMWRSPTYWIGRNCTLSGGNSVVEQAKPI